MFFIVILPFTDLFYSFLHILCLSSQTDINIIQYSILWSVPSFSDRFFFSFWNRATIAKYEKKTTTEEREIVLWISAIKSPPNRSTNRANKINLCTYSSAYGKWLSVHIRVYFFGTIFMHLLLLLLLLYERVCRVCASALIGYFKFLFLILFLSFAFVNFLSRSHLAMIICRWLCEFIHFSCLCCCFCCCFFLSVITLSLSFNRFDDSFMELHSLWVKILHTFVHMCVCDFVFFFKSNDIYLLFRLVCCF